MPIDKKESFQVKQRTQAATRLLLWYIILCSSIFLFSSCEFLPSTDDVTTLKVAVIGSFGGDLSDLGQSMRNGIVLATTVLATTPQHGK